MYRSYNIQVRYKYDFSEEKDSILKQTRGLGFKDVINAINEGHLLDDVDHFNRKKYPNQRIFIVKVNSKIYAVPYVTDNRRRVTYLKTFYPNSKLNRKYLKNIRE